MAHARTFAVSDVSPCTRRLSRTPVERAVHVATTKRPGGQGAPAPPLEAHSHPVPDLIDSFCNSFVGAATMAFHQHYPLVLSPDQVWVLLCQGFATHVNLNAERLRQRFVRHDGKLTLGVRRDDFVLGRKDNPWPEVVSSFGAQIAEHTGKLRDLVVADFSTTTAVERAASTVVLMEAMSSYFEYELVTMCGIPSITLLGTPDDWRSVRTRAAVLAEYELDWWTPGLLSVLDEFVAASEGRVDGEFWRSFVKQNDGSGGPYITGWINALLPYIETYRGVVPNRYAGDWEASMAGFSSGLTHNQLPSGISIAPVVWNYLGTPIDLEFIGGFIGIEQTETGALTPALGWAVREARPAE